MGVANALTNAGRALITGRLSATSGVTATLAPYMGFGKSSTATASATSTALGTELTTGDIPGYARVAATGSQQTTSVTNDTYQVQATLNANGASSAVAVTEAGNFDATSSGNLMIYSTFAANNIAGSDTLTIKLSVQFQ